jgi:nitrile hydratase subunit beta
MNAAHQPRFKLGDAVRVDHRNATGHCRAPWYVRGQPGVIGEILGVFRDPERLAYHRPGLPSQVLYKVRFKQTVLWPNYAGAARDHLEADISENWLVPGVQAPARAQRRKT